MKGTNDVNSKEFSGLTKARSYWEASVHSQVLVIKTFFQAFHETAAHSSSSPPSLPEHSYEVSYGEGVYPTVQLSFP